MKLSTPMTEAIEVPSDLVELAVLARQWSVMLYETVASFRSHQQRVHDLVEETGDLVAVLLSLVDAARGGLGLPIIVIPLKRCVEACQEFHFLLEKLPSTFITGNRANFRDWVFSTSQYAHRPQ